MEQMEDASVWPLAELLPHSSRLADDVEMMVNFWRVACCERQRMSLYFRAIVPTKLAMSNTDMPR
jgi:hypothetical protein